MTDVRCVIFDLDEVLLNRRPAWAYTIEQALLSVTGACVDPSALIEEYRHRPWRHALNVLEADRAACAKAAALCEKMWERSALKRITVHEGIGMALGGLLASQATMAAVTSTPLPLARRQAQAAGVDRFLVALQPHRGAKECAYSSIARLLNTPVDCVAFVSGNPTDLALAADEGLHAFLAGWASQEEAPFPRLSVPLDLSRLPLSGGVRR